MYTIKFLEWTDKDTIELESLRRADLSGADLSGADLSGADLSGADLRGADLFGANLSGADLFGADLFGANLSGADLFGADLFGADLRMAKGVLRIGPTTDGWELFGVLHKDGVMLKAGCEWRNAEDAKTLIITPERQLFYDTVVAWAKLQQEG